MQYTIKDILNYNNPCIQCEAGTVMKLWIEHQALSLSEVITYSMKDNSKTTIEFPIKYTYDYSLKLMIDCSTNEYVAKMDYHKALLIPNLENFNSFLLDNTLRFRLVCNGCGGFTEFSDLKFNDKFIGPVSFVKEYIYLRDEFGTQYYLSTNNETYLLYRNEDRKEQIAFYLNDVWWPNGFTSKTSFKEIILPAIPRSIFRDKADMLNAIQTYILLS